MLLHQLGKHLILLLQLGLQGRDPLFVFPALPIGFSPEGRGPMLKELLQPPIEDRGLKFLLLAKLEYRLLFQPGAEEGWKLSLPGCNACDA